MFNYQNPYPSTRLPIFARNVVATSHPLAAQAGLRMMHLGGNAVDAAIATAAAMTIVEPVSNGLGSDAFCMVWDGKKLHGLNASGCAPLGWTPEYFAAKYPQLSTPPKRGIDSVTVPGAVAAWASLSHRFGALPFDTLMQPAIDLAERGFAVPVVVQQKWAAAAAEFSQMPEIAVGFATHFLHNKACPQVGELFKFPAAARGLREIAATRGESFYRGSIAQAIAAFVQKQGGVLTAADLANYAPEWVNPIAQPYHDGYCLHEMPPNGQGIAAQIALGIVRHYNLGKNAATQSPDCVATQHILIEAMKLAFADVYRYVGEPDSMKTQAAQMLEPTYLAARAALIDPHRAQAFAAGNPVKGGTIYLSTADESGMMVSLIQSNYMGFGSGCVEPEYGISLQNRGHAFSTDPHSANTANIVAPGKRPFHTIIPAFLTQHGNAVMSFGVMGGNMQPQGHLQTLVRMLDYGQSPQTACDAPRWRFNGGKNGLELNVEASMHPDIVAGLQALGHEIEVINDPYMDFGAGQFIWRLAADAGYVAASDPRRDGAAVGF